MGLSFPHLYNSKSFQKKIGLQSFLSEWYRIWRALRHEALEIPAPKTVAAGVSDIASLQTVLRYHADDFFLEPTRVRWKVMQIVKSTRSTVQGNRSESRCDVSQVLRININSFFFKKKTRRPKYFSEHGEKLCLFDLQIVTLQA